MPNPEVGQVIHASTLSDPDAQLLTSSSKPWSHRLGAGQSPTARPRGVLEESAGLTLAREHAFNSPSQAAASGQGEG
jgi:hypothetical protein